MNLKFIHWNLNNVLDNLKVLVTDTIEKYDIVILSECSDQMLNSIKTKLNFEEVQLKKIARLKKWVCVLYKPNNNYKITHFTEILDDDVKKNFIDQNRVHVFKITGNLKETYFAVLHFTSMRDTDKEQQLGLANNYRNKIHDLTRHTDRVFIVGDFNMNPFDLGMISHYGFFAHNNQDRLISDTQKIDKQFRPLYYNPCWSLLGDYINKLSYSKSKRAGGSYYFESKKSYDYRWSVLDQIIIRKSLLNAFVFKDLEILESDVLINKHLKNITQKNDRIDHLPLKFSFNLKK